jgi:hypothetical protein
MASDIHIGRAVLGDEVKPSLTRTVRKTDARFLKQET